MKPKKFLFVSWESLSGDLAWQIKKEGHEVKIYINAQEDKDVYDGFLDKVENWKNFVDWADVIIFDDISFGEMAEELRKKGKLVVGGSRYTDLLENDRSFGQGEMKKIGAAILPHWNFFDLDEAISFLRKKPGRYVFKPNYEAGDQLRDLLFLGEEEEGKDLLEILESNKKILSSKIKSFQLQKCVNGVEIAVGAFFNGEDFIYPINVNFEHKRLFPGEIGPFTGEMGTLMYWSGPNRIFQETLARIKNKLKEAEYIGYIDINCIASSRNVYPLEFTSRFGYPTISIQMEGILTEMGEVLYKLANRESFELKTKKGFQVGVIIALTPYIANNPEIIEIYRDLPILFRHSRSPNHEEIWGKASNSSLEGIHLGDVKLVDNRLRVAGISGYVLVVTGSGQTVEEARAKAYARVKNVRLQNIFYRLDIGTKWYSDRDKLQTWGYL